MARIVCTTDTPKDVLYSFTHDVILMSGVPSQTTVASQAVQATYVAAMNSLAVTNGIMFIDIWNLMNSGSWAANNSAGLMSDNEHPNETGYGEIASWVLEGFGLVISPFMGTAGDNSVLLAATGGDMIHHLARLGGGVKTLVGQLDIGGGDANPEVLVKAGQQAMAQSVPVTTPGDQATALRNLKSDLLAAQLAVWGGLSGNGFYPQ